MKSPACAPVEQTAPRNGTVMVLVLVVVSLLSFAAYSFCDRMLLEYEAVRYRTDLFQQRSDAESGVELAVSRVLSEQTLDGLVARQDPDDFCWNLESESGRTGRRIQVLPMLFLATEGTAAGLYDESSRLNLNTLELAPRARKESVQRLLAIPRMTTPVAEAILDWLGDDVEGAGTTIAAASGTNRGHTARRRQGRVTDLAELLAVRGVTVDLLFGEDTNGNGLLDPNENDGNLLEPVDNADGALDRGWSEFLTVISRGSVNDRSGRPKIDLNSDDLVALFDQLEAEFGIDAARFVVGWRLAGSMDGVELQRHLAEGHKSAEEAARSRMQRQLRSSEEMTGLAALKTRSNVVAVTRGGIDLSTRPAYRLRSLLDLVGTRVRIQVDGKEEILRSPWEPTAEAVERFLVQANERLCIEKDSWRAARINLHQASRVVLQTVPGLGPADIDTLLLAQDQNRADSAVGTNRQTLAWLLRERVFDLRRLRRVAPYLCTGGSVFSGVSVATADNVRTAVVRRFVLDVSDWTSVSVRHVEQCNVDY